MNQRMSVVVRRASHVHQVPHTGLPQMAPESSVIVMNRTASSAAEWARRSMRSSRRQRKSTLPTKTTARAAYAVITLGTCTYMMRCGNPWNTSSGAASSAQAAPTSMSRVAVINKRRDPADRVSLLEYEVEEHEACGNEKYIKGPQELQLCSDRRQRLPVEDGGGGTDGGDQQRQRHRQHQDRQQRLAQADLRDESTEQRADRRQPRAAQGHGQRQRAQPRPD